jgi:hypothetical protein
MWRNNEHSELKWMIFDLLCDEFKKNNQKKITVQDLCSCIDDFFIKLQKIQDYTQE